MLPPPKKKKWCDVKHLSAFSFLLLPPWMWVSSDSVCILSRASFCTSTSSSFCFFSASIVPSDWAYHSFCTSSRDFSTSPVFIAPLLFATLKTAFSPIFSCILWAFNLPIFLFVPPNWKREGGINAGDPQTWTLAGIQLLIFSFKCSLISIISFFPSQTE